jgi:hypothetical protein
VAKKEPYESRVIYRVIEVRIGDGPGPQLLRYLLVGDNAHNVGTRIIRGDGTIGPERWQIRRMFGEYFGTPAEAIEHYLGEIREVERRAMDKVREAWDDHTLSSRVLYADMLAMMNVHPKIEEVTDAAKEE